MSRMMWTMHRATFLAIIASIFSLFVLGCSKPKPPTLTPDSTSITSVTPKGIGVRVTLAAYNPNDFALTTQKVSAKIVLGNKVTLGPIEKPHGVSLPANSTTKVTFDLDATWAQAAQIAQLATGGPTVPYVVDGTVTIGGKTLNVDLPFKLKGEVSQAQLIAAGLNGLKIPGLPMIR
jgi:LEA14-like dessication related protein